MLNRKSIKQKLRTFRENLLKLMKILNLQK
jgi:hypothetical protein